MTQHTNIQFNRGTVDFVSKFMTFWVENELHKITMKAKANRFRNFIKSMQQAGEYQNGKPSYLVCKQFFLNLDPMKWSKTRKKTLITLENTINKIFEERKLDAKEYLLESSATQHISMEDEIQATVFEWNKINAEENKHENSTKELTEQDVKAQLDVLNK